jgi:hypothetical protein
MRRCANKLSSFFVGTTLAISIADLGYAATQANQGTAATHSGHYETATAFHEPLTLMHCHSSACDQALSGSDEEVVLGFVVQHWDPDNYETKRISCGVRVALALLPSN